MRVEASQELINSYLTKGKVSEAIALCQQILKSNPYDPQIYPLLGKALIRQGRLSEAISTYLQALELQPGQVDFHSSLALLYSQQGNFAVAIEHYQQAISLKPNGPELHYNLAVIFHKLREWELATSYYQQAIALKPDYTKAYFNLGVLYNEQGNFPVAVANYRQAIAIEPTYISAYSNLGSILVRQKQFTAATEVYLQALKIKPTWATLHNNLGQIRQFQGKLGEALASYRRAIELEPNLTLAHHNLGRIWQQQGDYATAAKCFEQVIKLDPNHVHGYSNCAYALMRQGKLAPAMDHLRSAILLQPTFVEAYCQRHKLSSGEDLLSRAKTSCAQFLEALQQHFDLPKICLHLGQTYTYLGDILFEYGAFNQAEDYYQKALQIQPENCQLYLNLGDCLAKQNKINGAIIAYRMGLTLQPHHTQILMQLGNLLAKQNQLSSAISYYEKVLQLQLSGAATSGGKLTTFNPQQTSLEKMIQGIYPTTRDWIMATHVKHCQYREVDWQTTSPGSPPHPVYPAGAAQAPLAIDTSAPQCSGVTCFTCMGRLCDGFQPQQVGEGVFRCYPPQNFPIEPPSTFVTTIPDGRAWIAPQKSEWMITNAIAIITPDGYLLGDLSRHYPWYLPGCDQHSCARHPFFHVDEVPPVTTINGTVAILSSLSAQVYYHWLIDVLPRIGMLQQSGVNLDQIDWFVVNSLDKPFQRATLEILGIPATKIIQSDVNPHIQAQQLMVPSYPGHLDWVPKGTIKFLRATFLPHQASPPTNYPARIYISRANASYRQVVNEGEVINLLSKFGFVPVFLEKLTLSEQIALFAHAKVIVAPHGAGLTNLVFSSPGTKILEFFSPRYIRSDYWIITQQMGIEHYHLISESFDCYPIRQLMYQSPLTEDLVINLRSLESALRIMLS